MVIRKVRHTKDYYFRLDNHCWMLKYQLDRTFAGTADAYPSGYFKDKWSCNHALPS